MTIYEELIERVSNGETFHIDFEKQTMKVGKDFLIKNGEYDTSKFLFNRPGDQCSMDLVLKTIDVLYTRYKYSNFAQKWNDIYELYPENSSSTTINYGKATRLVESVKILLSPNGKTLTINTNSTGNTNISHGRIAVI